MEESTCIVMGKSKRKMGYLDKSTFDGKEICV